MAGFARSAWVKEIVTGVPKLADRFKYVNRALPFQGLSGSDCRVGNWFTLGSWRAKIATEFLVTELMARRLSGCVSWANLPLVKIVFVWNLSPKPANIFLKSPRFHIRISLYTNFHNIFWGGDLSQNSKGERLTNLHRGRVSSPTNPTAQ